MKISIIAYLLLDLKKPTKKKVVKKVVKKKKTVDQIETPKAVKAPKEGRFKCSFEMIYN